MTGLRLLCCLNRSLCNVVLVLVRIWSEQKEENDCYKDQCYDCSDSEGAGTCDNQTDLIYFAEEGLDLMLVTGFGADKVLTALISGEADIGFMGAEASISV